MPDNDVADRTERVGFTLQLRADRVEDYLSAHQTVWPEMLDALSAAGWRNYSLFIRKEDGLIVGYVETDDFDAACARMDAHDANTRWQQHMSEYFDPVSPGIRRLHGYFHLS